MRADGKTEDHDQEPPWKSIIVPASKSGILHTSEFAEAMTMFLASNGRAPTGMELLQAFWLVLQ